MDNAARCPQALGQAALAHKLHSPSSNKERIFLTGMKEKNRVGFMAAA
jgi:hypothetical protein